MVVLKNAQIVCPEKGVYAGEIAFEDGKIVPAEKEASEKQELDAKGLFVSAGFLDLHMHGGFGFDFETCSSVEELREALRLNALDGVVGVMPTHNGVEELSEERIRQYQCFTEVMKDTEGPELLGVHLEGPYFPAELAPKGVKVIPDINKLKKLLEQAPCIKRMSLAPEIENGLEAISFLEESGVVTALGHAAPDSETVKEAIRRGSRQILHLYSGMKGVYRDEESVRHPGLIELSYLYDELAVEVIANGKHMDHDLLRMVYKIKGADGMFLVTDSHKRDLALRGDKSQYVLKKLSPSDGKYHFNPAMPIPEMLRIMVQEVRVPIQDVIKMVTYTPARLLHLEHRKGKLDPGYDADIVAYDSDFHIKLVIARGKEIINEL